MNVSTADDRTSAVSAGHLEMPGRRVSPLGGWKTGFSEEPFACGISSRYASGFEFGPPPGLVSRMSRRSKAREVVVQMLYQLDINPDVPMDIVLEQVRERLEDEPLARFAWQLLSGVVRDKNRLDDAIEALAANWTLKRMAPTDRNVLRLGAFELLETETPPRVVIDEAVELAKRFGAAQSPQFVNGILDRLIPPHRKTSAAPSANPGAATDRDEEES